jgi:hypothetical protein
VVTLTKIPIRPLSGKTASIDLIVIDQEAHRLYAEDRTTNGVDVFDITTKEPKYPKTVDAGSDANDVGCRQEREHALRGTERVTSRASISRRSPSSQK